MHLISYRDRILKNNWETIHLEICHKASISLEIWHDKKNAGSRDIERDTHENLKNRVGSKNVQSLIKESKFLLIVQAWIAVWSILKLKAMIDFFG